MNERIKQLLNQAYDQAVPETWTTLSSEQLERVYEKFAELIVRESIQVVDDMADPEEDSDLFVWVLHNASEKIKQHFGVEE